MFRIITKNGSRKVSCRLLPSSPEASQWRCTVHVERARAHTKQQNLNFYCCICITVVPPFLAGTCVLRYHVYSKLSHLSIAACRESHTSSPLSSSVSWIQLFRHTLSHTYDCTHRHSKTGVSPATDSPLLRGRAL